MIGSSLCKSCIGTLIYSYQFTSSYKTFNFEVNRQYSLKKCDSTHTNRTEVWFAISTKTFLFILPLRACVWSRVFVLYHLIIEWPFASCGLVCGPMATTCPCTRANSIDLYSRYVFTIKCDSVTYSLNICIYYCPSYALYSALPPSTESETFPLV